ncbi:hypothetical protein ALC62_03129 [Cyphomyrmex costatus]|uniref:Uncharacterized protein n=1 Tax=Cyphomyrmex costatus TaxID=456900 RepID=A0A151IM38_9HYME|nr:hypothetical protein ALC62_03129 [Cyphomyrmex costatus]
MEVANTSTRSSDTPVTDTRSYSRRGSLPKIRLPTFNGDLHTWRSFYDLFSSMVGHNEELNNVEKMHYLKTCLAGDAAKLVTNLKVTDNTFDIAWKNLTSRYENKRVLISAQLDRLFNLKPIKAKSSQELNSMMATVTESLGTLQTLNCHTSSWDPLLVHQLSRLLDEDTREAWEVKLGSSTAYPTLKEFEEFVTGRTRAWETLAPAVTKPATNKGRAPGAQSRSDRKIRSLVATTPSGKTGVECRLCKSIHPLYLCPNYLSQSLERRKRVIIKLKLCFNCLGPHRANSCTSPRRCKTCSGKHHITLHNDSKSSSQLLNKNASEHSTDSASESPPLTLLATCRAKAKTRDGRFITVRMLLDQGSELSFVLKELVHRLGLTRKSAAIPLTGIDGTFSGHTKGQVAVTLYSALDLTASYELRAYILPKLTCEIPFFEVSRHSWSHLDNLRLADPDFGKPGPIHVIIGTDSYGQIIHPNLIKGDPSSPVAQLTLFGWVISGPVNSSTSINQGSVYHCLVDTDLQDLLTRFWEQEEIPKSAITPLNPNDADCEEQFRSTVSRDRDGRYIVRLPLKSPVTLLGDSSATALRCMSRLRSRLNQDRTYAKLYSEFLLEYQTMGHMVPVAEPESANPFTCYLPHHGVLRKGSLSSNIRVVFNGSSRTSSGISLNDILHAGAKLQTNIFEVLLWFRSHRFVFSSDIVKMYRQILLHPDDQDFQRIF